jgi:hypothetical protein
MRWFIEDKMIHIINKFFINFLNFYKMKLKIFSSLMALVFLFGACSDLIFDEAKDNGNGNNGNGNNKVENVYQEGAELKFDFNNAQFHCNAISGNGRVWPVVPADMKKFDGKLTFTKAEGTRWNLSAVADKKGASLEMVVCPVCGSTSWITFSNNSGEPDGKNIQMQHPGENFTISKVWEKNNEPYVLGTKFSASFVVTMNGNAYNVGPGNYFLPEGFTADVEEKACTPADFKLIGVALNGEVIPLGPVSGIAGGDVVAFTNGDEPKVDPRGSITATATLLESWRTEVHRPIYRIESGSKNSTLVSKQSTALGNGHTYFAANGGVHEIADSSPSNTGIGLFFKVEKRADGWYVVLDDKIVSASIGAVGFDDVSAFESNFRAPSHANITGEYGPIKTFVSSRSQDNAPVYTGDGYLYVHFSNIAWSYETNEIIGCELSESNSGTRAFSRSSPVFKVFNTDNNEVGMENLPLGTYTVKLIVGENEIDSAEAELVSDGQACSVNFGNKIVGKAPCVVNCTYDRCPGCSDGCDE